MPDLSTQLREYFDATASPIEVEEVISDDPWVPARQTPPKRSATARWAYGVAAAVVLLAIVFGLARLAPSGNEDEVADTSPPTVPEPTATGWWPQSNLDEVREAQERADAGDPDYVWQLDTTLVKNGDPWGADIFARFIGEELGWEAWEAAAFDGWIGSDGGHEQVVFIRCAPGETNPLSPVYAEAPPEIRQCAPTIDELTYETVGISVSQPGLRGSSGLWVVTRWETLQPKSPQALSELLTPDLLTGRQVQQVVPPSDTELAALLEGFLQARVDGAGAEQYLLHEPEEWDFAEVPLLYATTSGAPFERFEIERVKGPRWPTGRILVRVRLFAEGGTVVEQLFDVVRSDGNLGMVYGNFDGKLQSTENGQSVNMILDGEVTFATAPPWRRALGDPSDASDTHIRLQAGREEFVVIGTDPLPGGADCEIASAPADAEALAQSIVASPDFETSGTVPVRIAGLDGLQMDVDVNHNPCWRWWGPDQLAQWRTRLYLLDYPGPSAQILIIAVIAPASDLERVIEEATPIVDSLEIHTD